MKASETPETKVSETKGSETTAGDANGSVAAVEKSDVVTVEVSESNAPATNPDADTASQEMLDESIAEMKALAASADRDDSQAAPDKGKEAAPVAALPPQDSGDDETKMHAGEMLGAARLALGYSVEDIALKTKIAAYRIEAIEAQDLAQLPAASYTLGFVRTLARVVELPADALVERYKTEAGFVVRETAAPVHLARSERITTDLTPPKPANVIGVLALVVVVLWACWQVVERVAPVEPVDTSAIIGVPVMDRAREDISVTYEVETSLADDAGLDVEQDLPTLADDGAQRVTGGAIAVDMTADATAGQTVGEADSTSVEGVAGDTETQATDNDAAVADAEEGPSQPADDVSAVDSDALADLAEDSADDASLVTAEPIDDTDAPAEDGESLRIARDAEDLNALALEGVDLSDVVVDRADLDDASAARTSARIRFAVEPVYPARCVSAAADTETVTVRFSISRFGKVLNPVAVGATNACFERAAVAAVSRWDFEPAQQNGNRVSEANRTTRVVFQKP